MRAGVLAAVPTGPGRRSRTICALDNFESRPGGQRRGDGAPGQPAAVGIFPQHIAGFTVLVMPVCNVCTIPFFDSGLLVLHARKVE